MTWVTGVTINVFGSLSVNLSTNLIKLSHTKNYVVSLEHGPCPKFSRSPIRWWKYCGNKLWLFAIILFAIGNIANFASFAFAAQSLLSALGCIEFVSNVAFSKFVNKEKISRFVLAGTVVIVAGCVVIVSFGSHESPTYTASELQELYKNPGIIIYLSVGAVVAVAAYTIYRIGKRRVGGLSGQPLFGPWARWLPICYALFSGIPGTLSVLYGKSLSLLLRSTFGAGKDSQFGNWYTYVTFVLFSIAAMFWMIRFNKVREMLLPSRFLQQETKNGRVVCDIFLFFTKLFFFVLQALKLFPVSTMMPVLQVFWVLFSIISGSLYYQETAAMGTLELAMFVTGAVVLLAGVWLLTTSSKIKENKEFQFMIDSGDTLQLKELVDIEQQNKEQGKESGFGKVAVPRRHTVNVTAHGGLAADTRDISMFCIVEGEELPETEQESASIRIQRAVTAPLSGVIW